MDISRPSLNFSRAHHSRTQSSPTMSTHPSMYLTSATTSLQNMHHTCKSHLAGALIVAAMTDALELTAEGVVEGQLRKPPDVQILLTRILYDQKHSIRC